ncbi:MAG: exopolysaccharide biosynthesis protein WecB/TagA/CpsF family [Candidatus Acidoferrum typicum]|nr:exopolysaccharide biosynthesis protein WecB/TagA/CpsF family [Candidatus Acidoferrum typicum]
MKIVQMVTQMEGAGAQKVAYLLHQSFLERGYDSELWFLYLKRPAYSGKEGVRVLWERMPYGLEFFSLVRKMFTWIRVDRPDVVITHTHYANVVGHAVSVVAGAKCRIAVQHNPLQTYPVFARHVDRVFGTLGIYTAQVAVSETVVQSMSSYPDQYRNIVSRVYNGIVAEEPTAQLAERYLANVSSCGPKILHVGRFSKQKNHDALLQMMLQLPDANLILVGDGERRSEIEHCVKQMNLGNRVTLLGEIPAEGVHALMHACDLFLFPSIYEAMPMALLEAMAAGMAIVASDIPANREFLSDAGILSAADPASLAQAASRLLANPAQADASGRRAIERTKQFTVEATADGYEKLFPALRNGVSSTPSSNATSSFPAYQPAGIRVHAMTKFDLVKVVAEAIGKETRYIIANHNLHGLYCWFHEPKVRKFHESADFTHIDGMSLILLGRMLGLPLKRQHRTGYMDLLPILAQEAAINGWRIFCLGSKPGVAERAALKLRRQYSGLQIRTRHGHFDPNSTGKDNQEVLADINEYAPHILLVGMGMPRQESWIFENKNQISANAIFCCGALMDYVAGEIPTPPRWIGMLGFEWLLRLASEPRRLWRRYLVEPWFVVGQIATYYVRERTKSQGRGQ